MIEYEYIFSKHLNEKIKQRELKKEWIWDTIENPDKKYDIADDEVHFFKFIADFFNKCLKVVVNPISKIIVTAHFDRNKTKKGLR